MDAVERHQQYRAADREPCRRDGAAAERGRSTGSERFRNYPDHHNFFPISRRAIKQK